METQCNCRNRAYVSRAVQILVGLCTFLPQTNRFGKSLPLAGHVTSQKSLDQSEPFETKEIHANEVNNHMEQEPKQSF